MRNKISYEWVFEDYDVYGDIIDPMFGDTLADVVQYAPGNGDSYRVALTRIEGNDDDGLLVREYAYLKNGKLPIEFEDGYQIPKKYHKEVAKWAKA